MRAVRYVVIYNSWINGELVGRFTVWNDTLQNLLLWMNLLGDVDFARTTLKEKVVLLMDSSAARDRHCVFEGRILLV